MIKVTQEQWNNISKDYKGEWDEAVVNYQRLPKSWIGKKTVLEGCIGGTGCSLLTEGIHFVIE
jgi:hypothetical protein